MSNKYRFDGDKDRFDLEQSIMACSATADDIDLLVTEVLEAPELDRDKLANTLIGIKELTELRCNKTFSIFEHLISTRQLL